MEVDQAAVVCLIWRIGAQRLEHAQPHAALDPKVLPVENRRIRPVTLRHVAPRRAGARNVEMPSSTRRSSTRGTPGGLFGNSGSITAHSLSVKSKRAIFNLRQSEGLNHNLPRCGIALVGT